MFKTLKNSRQTYEKTLLSIKDILSKTIRETLFIIIKNNGSICLTLWLCIYYRYPHIPYSFK